MNNLIKTFNEFRKERRESGLDESVRGVVNKVGSAIKSVLKKIGDFFFGQGSNFLNMLVYQSDGKLPKGVRVFPTQEDIALLKEHGVEVKVPSINEGNTASFLEYWKLNEAVISLEHPNTNVVNVGVKEFKRAIRLTIESTRINPLLVWGAPGIGKTAIIEDIAKMYYGVNAKKERRIIDYDLMTMAPEDFFLPTVQGKTSTGDIGPDTRAVRVPDKPLPLYMISDKDGDAKANGPDGKGGIIFFDEIARCSQPVQNVCLKLFNERRLGDWVLGSKWVMIAAANREADDETGTYKFSSTLGNRVRQINYAPKFEDWNVWASSEVDEEGEFIVSREILAFVRFHSEATADGKSNSGYFYNLDPEVKAATGGSNTIFASPRSWTNASIAVRELQKMAIRDGERLTDDDIENEVAQQVGKDAAAAYVGFVKLMRQIDVSKIASVYDDPANAPTFTSSAGKTLQLDEKNALISAVVFHKTRNDKLSNKQLDNFITWLIKIKDGPFAIKAMALFQEVHVELKKYDFWEEDCKAKLFDAYPGLGKRKT